MDGTLLGVLGERDAEVLAIVDDGVGEEASSFAVSASLQRRTSAS